MGETGRSSGQTVLRGTRPRPRNGAGAFKSKSFQEREPPVSIGRYPTFWGRRIPTIPPEDIKETTKLKPQTQGGRDQDKEQGDMYDKRIPGCNRRKPRDSEDKALRKLLV